VPTIVTELYDTLRELGALTRRHAPQRLCITTLGNSTCWSRLVLRR